MAYPAANAFKKAKLGGIRAEGAGPAWSAIQIQNSMRHCQSAKGRTNASHRLPDMQFEGGGPP
jgi:hypothetical protein